MEHGFHVRCRIANLLILCVTLLVDTSQSASGWLLKTLRPVKHPVLFHNMTHNYGTGTGKVLLSSIPFRAAGTERTFDKIEFMSKLKHDHNFVYA
jgi:hypothetical protein